MVVPVLVLSLYEYPTGSNEEIYIYITLNIFIFDILIHIELSVLPMVLGRRPSTFDEFSSFTLTYFASDFIPIGSYDGNFYPCAMY